ncbi:MAG TPA: hypothetical protein VK623_01070 [Flavobacterium sp.]|nr:hypothetical protein [Flavobacterium sp.]
MNELREEVYKELSNTFKDKFKYSEDVFKQFFDEYVLNAIQDSDLLKEINKKNRSVSDVTIYDYLDNNRIVLRAIKLLTLLELSKDFKEFQKFNQRLKTDKQSNINIHFDRILQSIINIPKED